MRKSFIILAAVVVATGIVLSLAWDIPYIYTAIGFAAWAFVGHLVTADDDAPGGWSNPDGTLSFPWVELTMKGLVLMALCLVAWLVPATRAFGS
jgi:hypothetical protein